MMFLKLTNKDTTERLAARAVVVIGLITLILGTYVNLQDAVGSSVEHPGPEFIKPKAVFDDKPIENSVVDKPIGSDIDKAANDVIKNISAAPDEKVKSKAVDGEKRQEPAVPEAPAEKGSNDVKLKDTKVSVEKKLEDTAGNEKIKSNSNEKAGESKKGSVKETPEKKIVSNELVEHEDDTRELIPQEFVDEPEELVVRDKKESDTSVSKKPIKEVTKEDVKAEKLIKELAKQKEESAKILEQQKEILNKLEEHEKKDKEADAKGQANFQSNNLPAQSNLNVVPQVNPVQGAQNSGNIQYNPQQSGFAPNAGQGVQSVQGQPGQQQVLQQPLVQQQQVQMQVQPVQQQQPLQQQPQRQPVMQQQPIMQQQQVVQQQQASHAATANH